MGLLRSLLAGRLLGDMISQRRAKKERKRHENRERIDLKYDYDPYREFWNDEPGRFDCYVDVAEGLPVSAMVLDDMNFQYYVDGYPCDPFETRDGETLAAVAEPGAPIEWDVELPAGEWYLVLRIPEAVRGELYDNEIPESLVEVDYLLTI